MSKGRRIGYGVKYGALEMKVLLIWSLNSVKAWRILQLYRSRNVVDLRK